MADRILLEETLRKSMSYQGYVLERDPDGGSSREYDNGYRVCRGTEVVLGAKFSATLEEVAAWARAVRVGQPSLWHGGGALLSEEEE